MTIKSWPFLIGLILSMSLLWPLFAASYFTYHDDVSVIRLHQMNECFKDGQIPCRWVPDVGGLYGYPLFNYYAPLPYYFGQFIYLLSNSFLFSTKVMFGVSFVGSFIFMYLFAKKFWAEWGGSLAAIFYTFAPYHALDFYVRGAMGEMWALMFFPAILWAFSRLFEKVSVLNMLLLAIFLAGLATSHNLSLMIFIPVILAWLIFLYIKSRNYKLLFYIFFSFLIAISLSAFYILPMLFEKNLVHVETTTIGYFSYTEHFKGIRKLFLDRSWGYGSSIREVPGGEKEKISYQIGWVHLLGWLLSFLVVRSYWKKNRWVAKIILFSSGIILVAIFLVHPRAEFVWKAIEPLKFLQFPWRFLMLIILFISFVSGSTIFLVKETKRKILWIILVFVVVLLNLSYFKPEKFIDTNDGEYLSGENWEKRIMRSVFDYLPIFAQQPPAKPAKARYEILTGETEISDFQEGTNWFKFQANTESHTIVRLSQYYFPDWRVMMDGKQAVVEYTNNNLGLMTFILGKGMHQVEGRLYDTPIRTFSNVVTIFGIGLVFVLILLQLKKIRGWIWYYLRRVG